MKRICALIFAIIVTPSIIHGEEQSAKIISNNAIVRVMPAATSEECMRLGYGKVVVVIGRGPVENIDGNVCYWYRITVNGRKGWVFGRNILLKGSLIEQVFGRWQHYHRVPDSEEFIRPTIEICENGSMKFYYDIVKIGGGVITNTEKLHGYLKRENCHEKFFHYTVLQFLQGLQWKYNEVERLLTVRMPVLPERHETTLLFNIIDRNRDPVNGNKNKGIDIDYKNKIITFYLQAMFFDASKVWVDGGIEKRFYIDGWTYNKER